MVCGARFLPLHGITGGGGRVLSLESGGGWRFFLGYRVTFLHGVRSLMTVTSTR